MSNSCTPPPPLAAPLARSQTTCAEYIRDAPPPSRSVSCPAEFAATPTCPPPLAPLAPLTPPPTNCCAQFPEPPPSPPRLRRTDTSADYAVVSSRTSDPMYDRWLLEDNFTRLSAMEEKLRKQMSDLGMIRESLYQLSKRLNDAPAAPSSPVTRQVASPDMARDFGM